VLHQYLAKTGILKLYLSYVDWWVDPDQQIRGVYQTSLFRGCLKLKLMSICIYTEMKACYDYKKVVHYSINL